MMKTSAEIERILKKNIQNLKKDYNLNSMGIFGSFLKGEQNQDSDLDILVDFEKPIGLLKFIRLENDLSKILGIKVDLVMKKALKPNIGKRILEEIRYVS
jgi:predicted nucleotidyltransferase